jgi:hypothetical protein
MLDLISLIVGLVADLFRSRAALEAEILALRQQIVVLRRGRRTRFRFVATDRWVLAWVCRLFPNSCDALAIVRPETVVRWHRAGFRSYWLLKSRRRTARRVCGDPPVDPGNEHCQPVVGSSADSRRNAEAWDRYRTDQRGQVYQVYSAAETTSVTRVEDLSSQSCGRHRRHGPVRGADRLVPVVIWAFDHRARPATDPVAWRNRTSTAEWIANKLTEACGWERTPTYLIRDRDACYGNVFTHRLRSLGIRDHPTSPRSP